MAWPCACCVGNKKRDRFPSRPACRYSHVHISLPQGFFSLTPGRSLFVTWAPSSPKPSSGPLPPPSPPAYTHASFPWPLLFLLPLLHTPTTLAHLPLILASGKYPSRCGPTSIDFTLHHRRLQRRRRAARADKPPAYVISSPKRNALLVSLIPLLPLHASSSQPETLTRLNLTCAGCHLSPSCEIQPLAARLIVSPSPSTPSSPRLDSAVAAACFLTACCCDACFGPRGFFCFVCPTDYCSCLHYSNHSFQCLTPRQASSTLPLGALVLAPSFPSLPAKHHAVTTPPP